MSDLVTGVTFGGREWTPEYVTELDQENCIGCGRCFKTCPRDVFDLIEKSEAMGDDWDEDDDDDNSMVMSLKDPEDCIGCTACSKVCPKSCFTHAAKAA